MSSPLARFTAVLVRRPGLVVAAWALAIALALPLAGQLPGRLRDGQGIAGTESYAVAQARRTEFGAQGVAVGEPWIVVWRGERDPLAAREAINATADRLRALPGITAVSAPTDPDADPRLTAADGRGAVILVAPDGHGTTAAVAAAREAVEPLRAALKAADPASELALTGSFPLGNDLILLAGSDSARAEALLAGPLLLVLLLVFGSPAAATLPLLMAGAAGVLAFAGGALIAPVMGLNGFFQTIVSMLGLALGIDYALLIVARYRERRRAGEEPREAAIATAGTAGWTVACAGGVVMVSLGTLLPIGLLDARSVGLGGALVVAAAVSLALGLLPALLVLLDRWLDWPRRERPASRFDGFGAAAARALARRRWIAAPVALGLLLVLALPLGSLKTGIPDMRFYPAHMESVRGTALLDAQGRRGWTVPIQLLVRRTDGGPIVGAGGLGPLLGLSRTLRADPRVAEVVSAVDLKAGMRPVQYAALWADPAGARQRFPGLDALVSRDGKAAAFQVIPSNDSDVSDSMRLVAAIRQWDVPGLEVRTGGLAALNLDHDARIASSTPGALGVLLLATGLILGLMFRAVLVPVKAIALNLLVVAAALGVLVWVFQLGHGATWFGLASGLGTLPGLVPVLVFSLTFGLSMDYEVFMIGRVREERALGLDEGEAIARGLGATGGVIVAAALLMVMVCGAFVGAEMVFVKLFGAGMAVAILLDLTVVRLVLAPALLAIAGRWNWWPGDGH